jgi:hypothetical protein
MNRSSYTFEIEFRGRLSSYLQILCDTFLDKSKNGNNLPFSNIIFQLKEQLRSGLSSLPAPRNDYEIVVPDSEEETEMPVEAGNSVEDQADVDARYLAELKAKREQNTSSHNIGDLSSFLMNVYINFLS